MPKFEVGNLVKFGNGKVAYEVVAVITTGRITTYDLIGRLRRYQGVRESRLNPL